MKKLTILLICCCATVFSSAQNNYRTITGNILDESGLPIVAANVTLKGTRQTSSSDIYGKYQINVPDSGAIISFLMVGYVSKDITVAKDSVINVILENQQLLYEEVIVTKKLINYKKPVDAKSFTASDNTKNIKNADDEDDEDEKPNTEGYANFKDNPFFKTTAETLSTFSIDVDAASYSNIRRYIKKGKLPPAGAVRIEEMINYFSYDYTEPTGDAPFSINTEVAACPWDESHQLVMIGLKGKKLPTEKLPASNLVFLIDVSGSMNAANKLPLVKASLKMLTDQLRPDDKISIVVYAGNAGLVLPATSGKDKKKIKDAIEKLEAGGSTAGGKGIELAYKIAVKNFVAKGNNRVILCTDGDFNVGASSDDAMISLIEKERNSGIYLTVLGFGTGNYQDHKMEQLADKGNGNHAYIDDVAEARKVLVKEFGSTLFTIAKDVKLQVEFNPAKVAGYRLIGYENRVLANQDFNDDKKDAGELGSGHTVTALYELIPAGVSSPFLKEIDSLKYQLPTTSVTDNSDELLNIKFRYKDPEDSISKLLTATVKDKKNRFYQASPNLRFAAAVAGFGMLLRNSEYKGTADYELIYGLGKDAVGDERNGYRTEFLELVAAAAEITR